jgi:hypothetical protein
LLSHSGSEREPAQDPARDFQIGGVGYGHFDRGSVAWIAADLQRASARSPRPAATWSVHPRFRENNNIFARMRAGDIQGRIVIDFQE